jgi:hypothetical protein
MIGEIAGSRLGHQIRVAAIVRALTISTMAVVSGSGSVGTA